MSHVLETTCSLLVEEEKDTNRQRKQPRKGLGVGLSQRFPSNTPQLCLWRLVRKMQRSWEGGLQAFWMDKVGVGNPGRATPSRRHRGVGQETGNDLDVPGMGTREGARMGQGGCWWSR